MSPRRRNKARSGWPANLYERKGYFCWRHPQTREEFGLGRNKAQAFAQAVEANLHVTQLRQQPRLIHRLTGEGDRTVDAWNIRYQTLINDPKLKYAAVTLRTYKSLGKRMVSLLKSATPLSTVTALEITNALDTVSVTEGKARLAQALRNFMRDSFREAKVQGWYAGENPVQDSKLKVSVEVKRSRLSFEVFMQIYRTTKIDWLRNAMALALITGQRREDIALAQFKDFREGTWWCTQQSEKGDNPHHIAIPYELRLDVFGMCLGDVVSQCRRTGVLSPYLVHQTVNRGNSPAGRQIWVDTLSHRFAESVEALALDWGTKTPPTFHEIRSLSERLYSTQGGVNTQELLGHNDAETTAIYHDSRGSEWVRIKIGGSPK